MAAPKGNTFHLDRKKFGRDPLWKDEDSLSKQIQAYFDDCIPHIEERPCLIPMVKEMRGRGAKKVENIRPPKRGERPNHYEASVEKYMTEECNPTVSDLAVWLQTSRQTLINYTKKEAFFDTITRAKAIIHAHAEQSLWKVKSVNGIIFNLKNNWGWKDQSEIVTTERPQTGFEHLTKEEAKKKLNELRRKNGIK